MAIAAFLLWRGKLYGSRWMLWILLLTFPFPYIAKHRRMDYGGSWAAALSHLCLMRTPEGISQRVPAGSAWFHAGSGSWVCTWCSESCFSFLLYREIDRGARFDGRRCATRGRDCNPRRIEDGHANGLVPALWRLMIAVYVCWMEFDLGRGNRASRSLRTPTRSGARSLAPIGVSMGRQRGLADRGWRHALFCVSAALCIELQWFLLTANDGALAADPPRYFD